MICKNCKGSFTGQFCNHCGQKSSVGKITLPNFINEVSESFFQIDKGFFYTLKELCIRPGRSLNEYLAGKRKSHFKPISYLLTLSTVYFLVSKLTNLDTWLNDIVTGWMTGTGEQIENPKISEIASWFFTYYAYSTLLLVPIFSLASYLSFFKSGKTYLEHVVVNSYITGHQGIIYSFFLIGRTVIDSDLMEMIPVILAISYTFWVFWKLFPKGNRALNILGSALTYLLYSIFCLVLFMFLLGGS